MKRLKLLTILCLLFSLKVGAETIEFRDFYGTHLAYELNTETKEATIGIYNGFIDGNPYATAISIHWEDKNDYYEYFKNLKLPNTIKYGNTTYTITSIAPYAFCEEIGIKTITIPETIKTIGFYAFYRCINLISINIPNCVTSIESGTFEYCKKLNSMKLGNGIRTIGSRSFFDCHELTEINIPGSCTYIENDAFGWCKSLRKLTIEDGNRILEFGYCYELSNIYSGSDEAEFRGMFADCPIEELYLGRNITFPIGTNKSYPPFKGISNYCTNSSGYQGPDGKNIKKLEFGDFVTNLPKELFYKSTFKCDIILPQNIETIEEDCFNLSFFNNNQTEIVFPKSLKSVGTRWLVGIPFITCEGSIPASGDFSGYVVTVPSGAGENYRKSEYWEGCCIIDPSDEIITINVKKEGTLYSRLLAQDIQVGDVTRLKLKGILNADDWSIVKSMTYMYELDLSEIQNNTIPSFTNRKFLSKIKLPKLLNMITDEMFYGCTHLNCIIEIPENCTKIGAKAFSSTLITGLSYFGTIEIGDEAFRQCTNLDTIYISGVGSKIGYHSFWSSSVKKVIIGKGVDVADEAFLYNQKLEEVILEDSVKSIGSLVFDYCDKFTKLTICGIVENISDMKYKNLSEVNIYDISKWIQNKFNKLEHSPLYYGKLLVNGVEPNEIIIPDYISRIENYTFYNCNSIQKLTLSKNCTEIGDKAFYGCEKIDTLILPDKLNKIGIDAFYGLSAIKQLKLPLSINTIGDYAFNCCSSLKTVIAQWDNPFSISSSTFNGVPEDCYLYIPILTASKYRNAGWKLPNLKEIGFIKISSNIGGNVEYNNELISNTSKEFLFTPYKSFYINFTPEDGYILKRVKLNGKNVTSTLEDNKLYIDEPEENMDISVSFADRSIEQGDVNGDKNINVTDVVKLASYILKSNPNNFYDYWGDMNNDDIINITDIIIVINKILQSN